MSNIDEENETESDVYALFEHRALATIKETSATQAPIHRVRVNTPPAHYVRARLHEIVGVEQAKGARIAAILIGARWWLALERNGYSAESLSTIYGCNAYIDASMERGARVLLDPDQELPKFMKTVKT